MNRSRAARPLGLLMAVGVLAGPGPAEARSQVDLAWPLKDVFPIAVRFVRVDRNCHISDRDDEAGYIVFECAAEDGGKGSRRGALELITRAGDREGRYGVKAQLTLAEEPRYMELRFLELLERKIRDERGPSAPRPAPPPVAPPPPPPPAPDAGR